MGLSCKKNTHCRWLPIEFELRNQNFTEPDNCVRTSLIRLRRIKIDERENILKMLAEQKSMRQISEKLGRDAGTISRELRRNLNSTGEYKPHLARRYYHQRRDESKQPYRLEEDGSKQA